MTRDGYYLIVNPAVTGRAKRLLPAVRSVLDDAGVRYREQASASLAHAKELAAAAAGRGEVVVGVGGDGTAGALAAAVASASGVLGIIPAGRGNDFARTLGLPAHAADATRVLLRGRERRVDLIGAAAGRTGESTGGSTVGDAAELVVAGSVYLGVPAVTAKIAARSKVLPGTLAYPVAALRAIAGWQPAAFRLELDGDEETRFDGSAVVVANSRYFGAGMMVAPDADPGDGLLDVVFIRGASKLALVRALARIRDGGHVSMSPVGIARAATVTVTAGRPMPGGADGEPLACAAPLPAGSPLRLRALPGALRVLS